MANVSVEQALKSQVKFDIGDDEDITFKQKNMLLQKYGVTPAVLIEGELDYWEMRTGAGDLSDAAWQQHVDYVRSRAGGAYVR
jgi:hypothetical protein